MPRVRFHALSGHANWILQISSYESADLCSKINVFVTEYMKSTNIAAFYLSRSGISDDLMEEALLKFKSLRFLTKNA